MTKTYSTAVRRRVTPPQTQPLPGREKEMVKNEAGGYGFEVTPLVRFHRFLILGTEGGTYYRKEQDFTKQNLDSISDLFDHPTDGSAALDLLREISVEGRAPKQSPILVALALAFISKHEGIRTKASQIFHDVVRTHSHLCEFVSYVDSMRGWGRLLKRTVARWYELKNLGQLDYQLTKYGTRNDWSATDIIRMAHPKFPDKAVADYVGFVVGKKELKLDTGFAYHKQRLQNLAEAGTKVAINEAADLIASEKLIREVVPTELLNYKVVWEALTPHMPATALLRSLGKMAAVGYLQPLSAASKQVSALLQDSERFCKARVHPVSVLMASLVYGQGRGMKGSLHWTPCQQVRKALEELFYATFKGVEPANKNFYLGLDVSGSMGWEKIAGTPLMPSQASAVMAMVTMRTEPWTHVAGFCDAMKPLNITAKTSLDHAMKVVGSQTFGSTDCAQPMLDAMKRGYEVDTFVVYTDNAAWVGQMHASTALQLYREKMNRPHAKLIVVSMTATNSSIADPKDPGMLDIVGFDSATPSIISGFAAMEGGDG